MRPHLTNYQAKFRKWYSEQLENPNNHGKSPQEIQKTYLQYHELTSEIRQVNTLLRDYATELYKLVNE